MDSIPPFSEPVDALVCAKILVGLGGYIINAVVFDQELVAGDFGVVGSLAGTGETPGIRNSIVVSFVERVRWVGCIEGERSGDKGEEEDGECGQTGGGRNHFLNIVDGIRKYIKTRG